MPSALDIRALIAVPLLVQARALGALAVYNPRAGHFTPTHLRLLRACGVQAAIALELGRLHGQQQRQTEILRNFYRLSTRLNQAFDARDLYQLVAHELARCFGYRYVSLYRLEDSALRLKAQVGHKHLPDLVSPGQDISSQAALSGRPLLYAEALPAPDTSAGERPPRSQMSAPLMDRDTVIGALTVASDQPGAFGRFDLDLLVSLADQIVGVIQKARLSEEIRQAHPKYRRLVDHASDAILLFDPTGQLVEANPQASQLFGGSAEDSSGRSLVDLVAPASRAAAANWLERLRAGEAASAQLQIAQPGGQPLTVEINGAGVPLRDQMLYQGIARDLTERTGLEEQTLRAERLRVLGQLASGVAHDLNNVLSVVLARADYLIEQDWDDPDAQQLAGHPAGRPGRRPDGATPTEAEPGAPECPARAGRPGGAPARGGRDDPPALARRAPGARHRDRPGARSRSRAARERHPGRTA